MTPTKKYVVGLNGCDDENQMTFDLTTAEFLLLEAIAAQSRRLAHYSCIPRLSIEAYGEHNHDTGVTLLETYQERLAAGEIDAEGNRLA